MLSGENAARILTPDQRLRVFVSSTLQELAPERTAASQAIAGLRLTPVLFELGARPHPPRALYRSYLAQSHLFVGVYWQSYGWVAPGESISGIEDEYRLSDGLPRLLYIKEPAPDRDALLEELLERVRADAAAAYKRFATPAELEELLARDLALVLTERYHASATPEPLEPAAHTLPAPGTSFVGREAELRRIEELLGSGIRLLTLTGPGGIGKTRLAVEAARRLADRFTDGAVYAALDGLASPEVVPAAIVDALGVREPRGDGIAALVDHLRRRRLLLVLDNFEHVIAAAPIVSTLLEGAPGLTVLATSRELLRLTIERELQVPPLSPDDEAVALFAERAATAREGFELEPRDRPVAAEICRRLDGVPLAIELAAARIRLLTPSQLLDRLSSRLALTGPRDAPARQRTLEATIGWSYGLLAEQERLLFERLGVFRGSFTIEAAEEVAALGGELELLDVLSSLLDKSMAYRLPHLGETRFAMLRMIREFALEQLADAGTRESTLDRFGGYYVELAGEAADGLRSDSQREWKRTLDLEADNFRAALGWAADRGKPEAIAGLMRGLWLWFWLQGNLDEGREWVARGLTSGEEVDACDRGLLVGLDGTFAVLGGDFAAGVEKLGEAEALLVEAGDLRGAATMKLVRSFGTALLEGEERATAQLEEVLAAFEELDDRWGIGTTLHGMSRLRVVYDRYEGAGDLFDRAVAAAERVGDVLGIALASGNLAMARLAAGDVAGARATIDRVLEHRRAADITYAADDALDILARVEHAEGAHERAIALLAAADALRQRFGTPLWAPARERHERLLGELRTLVGAETFEAAYARGATLDVDDVHEIVPLLAPAMTDARAATRAVELAAGKPQPDHGAR